VSAPTQAADATTGGVAPLWLVNILRANLVAQIGIVVTGGLVRLTGSGLGCPTWPECADGSLIPTERQAESWHKYVEFGNRTLTFVLGILAIAALAGAVTWALRRRGAGLPPRSPVVLLSAAPLVGTVAQAVLGGITVLTGLHPATVAAHFLLSIAIIGACVLAVDRAQDPADQPVVWTVRPEIRWLGSALVAVAVVVIVLGTVVTGSGPNSGDADVTHRFGIDQRMAAWVHADAVYLFVGLVIALLVALRLTGGSDVAWRRAWMLAGVTALNGLIGYAQLFLGLPWLIVASHMLVACLLWVAVIRARLAMRRRGEPLVELDPPGSRASHDTIPQPQ
jgi:cytochrome c oxidase assembly protein subunit 15